MIDREKVPEKLNQEMLHLFGQDKAEQIVNNVGYSYHGLIWMVTDEKIKRKLGIRILPLLAIILLIVFILDFAIF